MEGKYTAWFKTPIGEGSGVVELGPHGRLSGRDTTFTYAGTWEQDGNRLRAAYTAKRTTPGPPGVFGLDELDIVASGRIDDGVTTHCTGFAKQTPGIKLEITLIRMDDG